VGSQEVLQNADMIIPGLSEINLEKLRTLEK
jgi:hypothetical protein